MKYYKEKGYNSIKLGEEFLIKIEDIHPRAATLVEYQCEYCEKYYNIRYLDYVKKKKEFVRKDCCPKCIYTKKVEEIDVKYNLGILPKTESGYWKFYKNRLYELNEFLRNDKIDSLLNIGYIPLMESIRRHKDNIINMIFDLNLDIYNVTIDLSKLYSHINIENIPKILNLYINKHKNFPSLLEILENLKITYGVLMKLGGYYHIKNIMGYLSDENYMKMSTFQYDITSFNKYNNQSGIYKITNIKNGKIYIGQASNIWDRIRGGYLYALPKNKCHNKPLQRAWNKDGGENFCIEIIEFCDIEKLNEREQYWIDITQCFNNKIGYNIASIAGSNLGVKQSEETKKKKSIISSGRKGWSHTKESKKLLSEIKSIPILQFNLEGKIIKEWNNAIEAATFLNGNASNIRCVLSGKFSHAYGYLWIKKDEYNPDTFDILTFQKRNKRKRKVVQLDLQGNFIKSYNTLTEAHNETSIYNIQSCCAGIQKTSGSFKWMYEEDYLNLVN